MYILAMSTAGRHNRNAYFGLLYYSDSCISSWLVHRNRSRRRKEAMRADLADRRYCSYYQRILRNRY